MTRVWFLPLVGEPAGPTVADATRRLLSHLEGETGGGERPFRVVHRADWHLGQGLEGAVAAVARVGGTEPAAGLAPTVDGTVCGGCGLCVSLCPQGAIGHDGRVARVEPADCHACGDCLTDCYLQALRFPDPDGTRLRDRQAAAARDVRAAHGPRLAVVLQLLPPDGAGRSGSPGRRLRPALPALGLLAGTDPFAVDAAAGRLLREAGWTRPVARTPDPPPPAPWPDDPGGWRLIPLSPDTFGG